MRRNHPQVLDGLWMGRPKLHRAGELTTVWVPDQTPEAIRDLVRARQAAVRTLRQARHVASEPFSNSSRRAILSSVIVVEILWVRVALANQPYPTPPR